MDQLTPPWVRAARVDAPNTMHVQQGLMLRIPSVTPRVQNCNLPLHGHVQPGLMLRIPSVTLRRPKLLYGSTPHVEWACIRIAPRLHFRPRFA
jgi:hypothetical protein